MKQLPLKALLLASAPLFFIACSDDDDNANPNPQVAKEWTLALSPDHEIPAPDRSETATAALKLLSDNSLSYTITVNALAAEDQLGAAHLRAGNPVQNGESILNLGATFTNGTATGTITGLRQSLVDSLKNDANEIYLNINSTQVPSGLVRAQLNNKVDFAADTELKGSEQVPVVETGATGFSSLRLTADKKLFYKLSVEGLEEGDSWTGAHIHSGAPGETGEAIIALAATAEDFNVEKSVTLNDDQFNALKGSGTLYINAHTTEFPDGKIRGQIR